MIRALALALVPLTFLALASITQASGGTTLVVHVINDLDEDGVRDEGEPGLAGWSIGRMSCTDVWIPSGTTEKDGTVTFTDGHFCLDLSVPSGWLPTSPTRLTLRLGKGTFDHTFLVRHVGEDVQQFRALPIVNGLPAPVDASIDALVDTASCGESVMSLREGLPALDLYVLGQSERSGCAELGDTISFVIDGELAGTATFGSDDGDASRFVVGALPMYFRYSYGRGTEGAVTPYVGGEPCGAGVISWFPLSPPNNQFVFVQSEETASGCGRPSAIVTLRSGDVVIEQILWEEGLQFSQRIRHAGDASCDREVDAMDAALILQRSAHLLSLLECEDAADVDQDSWTTAVDAALVLQLEAGLIDFFP